MRKDVATGWGSHQQRQFLEMIMSQLLEASTPNRETEYQGSEVALATCQSIPYQDHPHSLSKRG